MLKSPMMMMDLKICDTRWLRRVIGVLVVFSSLSIVVCSHSARFSAPLNSSESEDGFKPLIVSHYDSEYIARNLFTETGQYRIFSPVDSDLRMNHHRLTGRDVVKEEPIVRTITEPPQSKEDVDVTTLSTTQPVKSEQEDYLENALRSELKGLESLLVSYLGELFTRKVAQQPGVSVKISEDVEDVVSEKNDSDADNLERSLKRFARSAVVNVALPRAVETGRLFFFSGLKKILWPVFVGIQVIKTILFALFLPSIIGSLGKIAGQGSASVAGFNRPSETVSDLNFKDNFEDDSKFTLMNGGYAYNQPEASTNHFSTQLYEAAESNKNNALSRFGMMDQRDNFMNSIGYDSYTKTNTNADSPLTYQSFKKVPASSLLLSNYDPFYSPLLSRLDSVFQQLGLKTTDENCREKLICSMYANPAMYAPYSNLVSAQLSRELDELRKPTSENPEILRFFKYMKAAKDGQDGVQCEVIYSMCTEFKDIENPAMINTYNDINKLVEARKLI